MVKRLEITVDGERVYSCALRSRAKAERLRDRFWPNGVISECDTEERKMNDKSLQAFSEIPDEWYDEEGNVIMPSYTVLSGWHSVERGDRQMKEMRSPRGQEPERCKYCGTAMEWYGEQNGIIGWHLTYAGANTDTGDVCASCRVKELRGELGKK